MEPKLFSNAPISKAKMKFLSNDVHLDAALNELHMLSTTSNIRLEYLKEKARSKTQMNKKTHSDSQSVPLCVVQMNPDFVTKFSVSKDSASTPDGSLSDESAKTELVLKAKVNRKLERRTSCNSPYARQCRKRLNSLVTPVESSVTDFTEEKSDLLIVPHQDCGNKSNPSSPVKSQNSSKSVVCSIFRSRSLDDLEISKLNLEDSIIQTCHGDIDNVSHCISKLHVS